MNADGSRQRRLTSYPNGLEQTPDWSPDKSRIAFYSNGDNGSGGPLDIFIMNKNGSQIRNLTNSPVNHDVYPTWSPDGTQLAFVRFDYPSEINCQFEPADIYRINDDGTGQRNITNTNDTWTESTPDW